MTASPTLHGVLKAMVGMTAAALIAWGCYAFDIFPQLPAFLPFMLNLMLFALALGIIITGLIFRGRGGGDGAELRTQTQQPVTGGST